MAFSAFKSALLAAGLSLGTLLGSAQTMPEIIAKPEIPLTWMGLDFTAAKYVGDPGTVGPEEMKDLFGKMNELMVSEADKYDFAKAFHRQQKVSYANSMVEAGNARIDPGTLLVKSTEQVNALNAGEIQHMVQRYAYPAGASGIGLLFVMEALNKPQEKTIFWVTFVDLATKKVLYTEKVQGTALGFGFRNHWAGGIYAALKQIKIDTYGKWKKKFAKG
jgi:hypothetical protein